MADAVAAIRTGSLRKVVLARDVFATAAEPIDTRVVLRRLAGRYPDCFTFACDGLVGATPELLVRRVGREVSALVLGGTAPRGGDPARDEVLGAELLASAKNTEEHAYAVASIRDGLGPLCDTLEVEPRPSLVRLPNLQHLGTHIRGTLTGNGTPKSVSPWPPRSTRPPRSAGLRPRRPWNSSASSSTWTASVTPAGRLGRRRGERRVGHRAALRAAFGPHRPAVRRLRHRGGFGSGRRARRNAGQASAHARRAGRLRAVTAVRSVQKDLFYAERAVPPVIREHLIRARPGARPGHRVKVRYACLPTGEGVPADGRQPR